ncbi:hypothetical protein H0H93_016572 [Arthromyces matolae]|nr:hypothetical protein H0H93_016572 [Arthromyces matolae]
MASQPLAADLEPQGLSSATASALAVLSESLISAGTALRALNTTSPPLVAPTAPKLNVDGSFSSFKLFRSSAAAPADDDAESIATHVSVSTGTDGEAVSTEQPTDPTNELDTPAVHIDVPADERWYVVTVGTSPGVYQGHHVVSPLIHGVPGFSVSRVRTEEKAWEAFYHALDRGEVCRRRLVFDEQFLTRATFVPPTAPGS